MNRYSVFFTGHGAHSSYGDFKIKNEKSLLKCARIPRFVGVFVMDRRKQLEILKIIFIKIE